MMFYVFGKAFHDYSQPDAGYAKPLFGIQIPIVIGIGTLLLGVPLMLLAAVRFRGSSAGGRRLHPQGILSAVVEPRPSAWWLEQALAAEGGTEPAPALAGDTTTDVAIVGGGYTGLWTALALHEQDPDLRVTLLESDICGAGPSGRNGGFLHGYWASLASARAVLGDDDAMRLARAAERDRSWRARVRRATRRGRSAA